MKIQKTFSRFDIVKCNDECGVVVQVYTSKFTGNVVLKISFVADCVRGFPATLHDAKDVVRSNLDELMFEWNAILDRQMNNVKTLL